MEPTVVFTVHHAENGERIVAKTAPLMPTIEWDMNVLEEIDSLVSYGSHEVNESNELIVTYSDSALQGDPEALAAAFGEHDQFEEILARATGRDVTDARFEPCPCLMPPMLVIGVSFAGIPQSDPSHN